MNHVQKLSTLDNHFSNVRAVMWQFIPNASKKLVSVLQTASGYARLAPPTWCLDTTPSLK